MDPTCCLLYGLCRCFTFFLDSVISKNLPFSNKAFFIYKSHLFRNLVAPVVVQVGLSPFPSFFVANEGLGWHPQAYKCSVISVTNILGRGTTEYRYKFKKIFAPSEKLTYLLPSQFWVDNLPFPFLRDMWSFLGGYIFFRFPRPS